jgi:hypothetical protein
VSVKEPKAKATGKGAVQASSRKPKTEKTDSKATVTSAQTTVTIPDTETRTMSADTTSTPPQAAKKKPTNAAAKKAASVIPQATTQDTTLGQAKRTATSKAVVETKEAIVTPPLPAEITKPAVRKKVGVPAKAQNVLPPPVGEIVQQVEIKTAQPSVIETVQALVVEA